MMRSLAVLTVILLTACSGTASRFGTAPGEKAPPWNEPLSTGERFSFASLRGAPIYVDFFATWCPPCNVEAPWIEDLQRRYAARGLKIVGVDMQESATLAQRFRAKYALTYPVVVDSGTLQNLYNINGLPVHVFIARNGTIQKVVVGEMARADIEAAVKSILNEGT